MAAPTIVDPPELPSFPSGPGRPDQPGVFIPKFLLFLAWLESFRTYLTELRVYLEGLGGGASECGGGVSPAIGYRPMVDGSDPPVFIIDDDHDLIMTEL